MSIEHTPWVAIRSTPQEGCDGWWIKAQPHAALRGFTHDIAWVNGGEENADKAALIVAAPDLLKALMWLVEHPACQASYAQDSEMARRVDRAVTAILKAGVKLPDEWPDAIAKVEARS